MRISELIFRLERVKQLHGDVSVVCAQNSGDFLVGHVYFREASPSGSMPAIASISPSFFCPEEEERYRASKLDENMRFQGRQVVAE